MFELVKGTQAASLYIAKEADDFAGLSHVAEKIQKDIELVTGVAPKICDAMPEGYSIIPGIGLPHDPYRAVHPHSEPILHVFRHSQSTGRL